MSTTEGIGSSTSNQMSPGMAKLGSTLTTYLQDKLLKKVDVDENGTAEQSEFRAALEQLTGKLGVEMTDESEAMFTGLDADGSGGLDGQEMGQFLRNDRVYTEPNPLAGDTGSIIIVVATDAPLIRRGASRHRPAGSRPRPAPGS